MIVKFPDFTKLSLDIKEDIERHTAKFEPYSDFNFTSLFSWDTDNSVEISFLNSNLIIKMPDYITNKPVFSVLGKDNIDKTLTELTNFLTSNKYDLTLKLIPQVVVDNLKKQDSMNIKEDIDNHDYIYSINELVYLDGNGFQQKRNYIRKFEKTYDGRIETLVTNLRKKQDQKNVLKIFDDWRESLKRDEADIANELKAIKRLLQSVDHFELIGLIVFIDNEPTAFVINEVISDEYAILHFEKANAKYDKLSLFLKHWSSIILQEKDCRFVNYEQDLGIPGLRQAKKSYHPIKFLKKYTVSLK